MPSFGNSITPTGTLNGSNRVFTIPRTVLNTSWNQKIELLLNGVQQRLGVDYTVVDDGAGAGTLTITYAEAPFAGDSHEVA
jgi:hypothetical protein